MAVFNEDESKIIFYRKERKGNKQPVQRVRKGQSQAYYMESLEEIEFTKEQVLSFNLEEQGTILPRVNGNYTAIDNYFFDYWGHFLKGATTAFMHLLRHCYNKDTCNPSMDLIAGKMGISRPTLVKHFDTLEEYGFIYRFWRKDTEKNEDLPILFKVRQTIPFLSEALINKLPPILRKDHDKYIKKMSESYSIELNDEDNYTGYYQEFVLKGKPRRQKKLDIHNKENNSNDINLEIKKHNIFKTLSEKEINTWDYILNHLSTQMSKASFDTWFKHSLCKIEENKAYVYLTHKLAVDWVRSHYDGALKELFKKLDLNIEIDYTSFSEKQEV